MKNITSSEKGWTLRDEPTVIEKKVEKQVKKKPVNLLVYTKKIEDLKKELEREHQIHSLKEIGDCIVSLQMAKNSLRQ